MAATTQGRSRRRRAALVVILLAVLCASAARGGESHETCETSASSVSSAIDEFGFRLLHTLTDGRGGNVIISPLSVSLALAMTYNGAARDTRTAMAKTLGVESSGEDAYHFNRCNHEMLDTLQKADAAVQMEIANALWTQADFPINPNFLKVSRDFYAAPAEGLDFERDPLKAADTINTWVNRNTHGKIPTIIARAERNTRLILTDAVYFKGRWTRPFDKSATRPKTFRLLDRRSVQAPMMTQSGEYQYFESDAFQAIRLPYGNTRFVMYIFLPRSIDGLPELLGSLDGRRWREWIGKLTERKGTIVLPRFESKYAQQLNQSLKRIGIATAFDPARADFSRIHPIPPRLFINDVEHKTYVKVDEEGTEASAATSVSIGVAMVQSFPKPAPFEMVVDHPFFVAIAEQRSGVLLFAGVVTDPTRE
jgi:serpin B